MLGIIVGTSLRTIATDQGFGDPINTPFGSTSSGIVEIDEFGSNVRFMARHGGAGKIYAHKVNYRANVWALQKCDICRIIATATVGSIDPILRVGDMVVPDQIVDYTYGRDHTYFGELPVEHFDFTSPFTERLRNALMHARGENLIEDPRNSGTYGCTQGPRLETKAEIVRMRQDGCTLVGMTLMPEAALARELQMEYAALCLVVNAAAGIAKDEIDLSEADDIARSSVKELKEHLRRTIQLLS